MGAVIGMQALAWGDLGLFLAIPGSGLGNAAINAVGTPEQRKKYAKRLRGHVYHRARHRFGFRQHQHHRRARWRRVGDQRRERFMSPTVGAPTPWWCGPPWTSPWARPPSSPSSWKRARPAARLPAWSTRWVSAPRTPPPSASTTAAYPLDNILGSAEIATDEEGRRKGLRRRHADLRQYPPARGRDGAGYRPGRTGPDP